MRILLPLLLLVSAGSAAAATLDEARADLAARVKAAGDTVAVRGADGWLFPAGELAHYARSGFWGDQAPANAGGIANDPLAAIEAVHQELAKAGIELLVVPVPGKACLNPDRLQPPLPLAPGARLDEAEVRLHAELAKRGIAVLSLGDDLLRMKATGGTTHLPQDQHWSPEALERSAKRIAALIKSKPWFAQVPRAAVTSESLWIEPLGGDLAKAIGEAAPLKTRVQVRQVKIAGQWADAPDEVPAKQRRASPLLVFGDSHVAVYGDLKLFAEHAALPSQLAAELGFPVDSATSNRGAIAAPRVELSRRREGLAGKKMAVWVFSSRWYSTSPEGWPAVAITKER